MKKIFYLMTIVAVTFAACQKQPVIATSYTKTLTITLAASDYASLGSNIYAYKTKSFVSDSDAKVYISKILNTEYPQLDNGSIANVTFSEQVVQTDSVYKDLTYTLVTTPTNDYKLLPGNNFSDFSVSQLLSWMPYKFPSPVANQQEILTFAYYNGQTTATATLAVAYIGGAWQQIYLLTPAQYVSVGHPAYSQFTSSDDANIPSYINAILKADPSVMATVKVGSVQYVSFNYYNSSKVTCQRILTFGYNGTNWVTATTNTLSFLKVGGSWVPVIYVNEPDQGNLPDYQYLNGLTNISNATARANALQYGDFNIEPSSQYYWSDADLTAAFAAILLHKFPNPVVGVPYKITYYVYTGSDSAVSKTYIYNGTTFVLQP